VCEIYKFIFIVTCIQILQCSSEALIIVFFAEADFGMFSMFGQTGALQRGRLQRTSDSSATFSRLW